MGLADGASGGDALGKQGLEAETGVALPAVRVEDPEDRPATRWPRPVPGDGHLRPLADDVPAEPDPRPSDEFEPETGRLGHRGRHGGGEARRLEDHDRAAGPSAEGGEPAEPVTEAGPPSAR